MSILNHMLLKALLIFCGLQSTIITAEPVINKGPDGPPEEGTHDEFPFLVSIGKKGDGKGTTYGFRQGHFCGGSLISKQHILTAAHCLKDEVPADLRVLVGVTRFSQEPEPTEYDIDKWMTYNDWPKKMDTTSDDHDVAVIKLKTPVTDDSAKTIDLFPDPVNKAESLESAGWGRTEQYKTSPVLLKIPLEYLSNADCARDMTAETGQPNEVPPQHICTRSPKSYYLGEGDSGGPLLATKKGVKYVAATNEAYCGQSCSRINTHSKISYYKKFVTTMLKEL